MDKVFKLIIYNIYNHIRFLNNDILMKMHKIDKLL